MMWCLQVSSFQLKHCMESRGWLRPDQGSMLAMLAMLIWNPLTLVKEKGLHIPPLNGDKGHTWVMEVMNILLGWFRDSSSKHEQSINQDSQKKNHPTNSSSRIWSLDIDEGAYRRHIAGSCGICHGFWTLDMDVNSTRQIAIKLRKQAVPDVSRCLNDKGPF